MGLTDVTAQFALAVAREAVRPGCRDRAPPATHGPGPRPSHGGRRPRLARHRGCGGSDRAQPARRTRGHRAAAGPLVEPSDALIRDAVLERLSSEIVRAGVPQRVAEELVAEGVVERSVARVLAGPELETVVTRALEDPGVERLILRTLDSERTEVLVGVVADSPGMERMVGRVHRQPPARHGRGAAAGQRGALDDGR